MPCSQHIFEILIATITFSLDSERNISLHRVCLLITALAFQGNWKISSFNDMLTRSIFFPSFYGFPTGYKKGRICLSMKVESNKALIRLNFGFLFNLSLNVLLQTS